MRNRSLKRHSWCCGRSRHRGALSASGQPRGLKWRWLLDGRPCGNLPSVWSASGSALITRCEWLVGPAAAMPGWPLRAGVRSGCVPRGLNKSSSVDPEPSLGVRPNMQTRFAPKVEKTLGHCRKPHMGTGALRARKAGHRRVTPVGSVPSVHSGYADMVCGAGPRSGGLGVRIVISPDTSCIVYDTLDVETVTRVEVALRRCGTRRSSAAVGGWRQPVFSSSGESTQSR